MFSTEKLASVHSLQDYQLHLNANGINLERVKPAKLLGSELHEHLKWNCNILSKTFTCYGMLAVLRKMKHLAPFHARKQLAECLVLSRISYNDVLFHQVPNYLIDQLQHVQLAAFSLVTCEYADLSDILKLGWLPVKQNTNWNLCKLTYKALNREK